MKYLNLLPIATNSGNNSTTTTEGFTFSSNNANNGIWLGFDGNPATVFRSGIDGVGYAQVSFPKEFLIGKYVITVGFGYQSSQGGDMKSWRIDALINNTWTTIHTASHAAVVETLEFEFTPVRTSAIRIVVTSRHGSNSFGFAEFSLYEFVYDSKALIYQDGLYKTYQEDIQSWKSLGSTEPTKEIFLEQGIEMIDRTDFSMFNSLSSYSLLQLSDAPKTSYIEVTQQVEPFSVYDYISELPTLVTYTDSTDDIIIETKTEPFTIYDQFKDSIDVLYFTEVATTTGGEATLEANWTPIDDIKGDFDVVTWTDDTEAERNLEKTALPVPQFIYKAQPNTIKNGVQKLLATDLSTVDSSNVRFLVSADNITWYTRKLGNFVPVVLTHENILTDGMIAAELNSLTADDLLGWTPQTINIGAFLADDIRKTGQSKVNNIGYEASLFSGTSKVSDVDFYVLNTTATINVDLSGLTLTGQVDDADMTRVQYRVILNDEPYYPTSGDYTPLSSPPLNIDLTIRSEDVKIGDWNTIRVEFQDYFGSMDYWEAQFIGKYAGLMFMDTDGNYYSSDVGQVLQYLDFGQILTGQITPSYEVKVKNEYGFDIKNTTITVNTTKFAKGLTVQLANSTRDFETIKTLAIGDLADQEETSFFIRMISDVTTVPNNNKDFNIVVMAQRVI